MRERQARKRRGRNPVLLLVNSPAVLNPITIEEKAGCNIDSFEINVNTLNISKKKKKPRKFI